MSMAHADVAGRGTAGEPVAEFTGTGPLAAVVTLIARESLHESTVDGLTAATDAALQRAAEDADGVVVDLRSVT